MATKSDETKTTRKQKATWSAIDPRITRRGPCGSPPSLSAPTGLTDEARNAGKKAEEQHGQRSQAETE